MKNNFGIKIPSFSYFRSLQVFIQLPKYYIKKFAYNDNESLKHFPKNLRLKYGCDTYDVELYIWRTYNEVLEVKIKNISLLNTLTDEFYDCSPQLIDTREVQGVARMIRHDVYAVVKTFK